MSSRQPRRTDPRDGGFSLVEVVVAMGIFLVVMTAVLPLIVTGIRGTARAGQVTEEKGIVEGQFERMRNLPWHVAPNAGQFIDVLDRYYPNVTPPTATVNATACAGVPASTWTGYVKTTDRCSYEPANPQPFYRTVETIDPEGSGRYVVVTDVQFLSSAVPASPASYGPTPTAAPSTYNANVQGSDSPVSPQVGVTVTAFDLRLPTPKPFTDYTQIAENVRSPQRVQAVAEAEALELSGVDRQDTAVEVTAGQVDLNGFLAKLSSASGQLSAVEARRSSDDPAGLQVGPLTANAPAKADGASHDLTTPGQCDFVCWGPSWYSGPTTTSDVAVSSANGLPQVGSSTTPVEAGLATGSAALRFSNTPVGDRAYYRQADLGLRTDPLVVLGGTAATVSGCGASGSGAALGRGYVNTSSTAVTSCAETGTSTLSLFPTQDRSAGVLELRLDNASATCSATHGGTPTATTAYSLTAIVYGPNGQTTTKTLSGSDTQATRDAAVQALLQAPVVGGHTLKDYVAHLVPGVPAKATSAATSTASASVPAALTLTSTDMRNNETYDATANPAPTYTPDDTSAFTLRLGAVSCQAMDAR